MDPNLQRSKKKKKEKKMPKSCIKVSNLKHGQFKQKWLHVLETYLTGQ